MQWFISYAQINGSLDCVSSDNVYLMSVVVIVLVRYI